MSAFRHHKAVLPRYLNTRHNVSKRTFVLSCGVGAPLLAATFDASKQLYIVDAESLHAETLPISGTDADIQSMILSEGYLACSLNTSLILTFLGDGKQLTLSGEDMLWFFFDKKHLWCATERCVKRVRLEPTLSRITEYKLAQVGTCDGRPMIKRPTSVRADADSVVANNKFQVWNFFSKSPKRSQPAAHGAAVGSGAESDDSSGANSFAKFVMDGVVEGQFGIKLLRVIGDIIAGITHSGDMLSMWAVEPNVPGAASAPKSAYISVKQDRMATSLQLDDEYLLIGHIDGSISIYDRVSGKRSRTLLNKGDHGLMSDARIFWIERVGEYIYTASPNALQVRKIENLACVLSQHSDDLKFEKAYMDKTTGTVYALATNTPHGSKRSAGETTNDLITWTPDVKDLTKKKADPSVLCSSEFVDLSPPITALKHKPSRKWSGLEVVYWLASLGVHDGRRSFFNAGITGKTLSNMNDITLKTMGVDAVGHRRRILLHIGKLEDTGSETDVFSDDNTASITLTTSSESSRSDLTSRSSPELLSSGSKRFSGVFKPISSSLPQLPLGTTRPHSRSDSSAGKRKPSPRSDTSPRTPRSNRSISPRTPKLEGIAEEAPGGTHPELVFNCHVETLGENLVLKFSQSTIEMKAFLQELCSKIGRDDLNPAEDIWLTVAADGGDVKPIPDDEHFQELILHSPGSVSINVSISQQTKREAGNVSLESLTEKIIFKKRPYILARDQSFTIFAINNAALDALGYKAATALIGRQFDDTLVLGTGDHQLSSQVKNFDGRGETELVEWRTVLQQQGGFIKPFTLSAKAHGVESERVFQILLKDDSAEST